MNVGELIERLNNAQIRRDGFSYDSEIINSWGKEKVAWIVRDWAQKQGNETATRIAELEAKVYAYEQIIANSNFKAVLSRKKESKE